MTSSLSRFSDPHHFSRALGMSRYQKSGFFSGFWLGFTETVRPFKKNANHTWFNHKSFSTVYSRVSLTQKAQNLYFSSFVMEISFNGALSTSTSDCLSTEASTRRLRIHLSNEFDLYVTFHIILIYWIHWALKRSSNLSVSMSTEAAISAPGTYIVGIFHHLADLK